MAWGGPAEQQRDREAGNPDAKDWYDEALKIIEKTMEKYWQPPKSNTKSEIDDDATHTAHAAKCKSRPLESELTVTTGCLLSGRDNLRPAMVGVLSCATISVTCLWMLQRKLILFSGGRYVFSCIVESY